MLTLWNYPGGAQRVVLELKLGSGSSEALIKEGLEQTVSYMDRCGAEEGHLVIFDRGAARTCEEKIFHRTEICQGRSIAIWGM